MSLFGFRRYPLSLFLVRKLSIETPSSAYAAKRVTRNALFAVDIPYPFLKTWYDFLKNSSLNHGASKSENYADQSANSYKGRDSSIINQGKYTKTLKGKE